MTTRRVADIDWAAWRPTETATLLFVVRADHVLLMRKKRGLGAGKINAPGGRLEPGETLRACAVRELEEELRVRAVAPFHVGEHRFQFTDGYGLHVHVFRAGDCVGEAEETDEGAPLWTSLERIPYDEMWADDRIWLPHLLAGRSFSGRYIFEGDRMLDHAVVIDDGGSFIRSARY